MDSSSVLLPFNFLKYLGCCGARIMAATDGVKTGGSYDILIVRQLNDHGEHLAILDTSFLNIKSRFVSRGSEFFSNDNILVDQGGKRLIKILAE
ncbi:hypothetical protein [Marinobacter oulmenensis]|uniref:Uncharacterized protein n=1 Tax=Marinobacter oulmenensis TaxID=643747 RepID=A0A840U9V1_9GAMM|nr:hypothetical protein [Marinobacter oulmenensis]MBB5321899.1 hypothetical protein [Marinobacter oulmenensis]